MKHAILTTIAFTLAAGAATAASFTEINTSAKQKVNQVCNTLTCAGDVTGFIVVSGKMQITPQEQGNLMSDTRVRIRYQGYDADFLLSADPNFQNGDTSAKWSSTAVPLNGTGKITANLSWGNGVLVFSGRLDLKASVNVPHQGPENTVSSLVVPDSAEKHHQDQTHYNGSISVEVERDGNPVFGESATVYVDQGYSVKGNITGDGAGNEKQTLKLKSAGWIPLDI